MNSMGDAHRISKEYHDAEFEKLLRHMDTGKIGHNLSEYFIRPAYQYTKAECKGLSYESIDLQRVSHIQNV